MVQHLALAQHLPAAGNFAPFGFHIITPRNFGAHAKVGQSRTYRLKVAPKIHFFTAWGMFNKGKIQIARIMIHSPAAGYAAHHRQLFTPDKVGVHLVHNALVAAHNNRGAILPKQKIPWMPSRKRLEQHLFKREVNGGIKGRKRQVFHATSIRTMPRIRWQGQENRGQFQS